MKITIVFLFAATSFFAAGASVATAQKEAQVVRDAVYRGTLVCSKLPFLSKQLRASIEATVSGNSVRYRRPVVMAKSAIEGYEEGSGSVDGTKMSLKGSWKKGASGYEATYAGNFVRRNAKLTGTQIWSHDGKAYTRTCTGSIKRPLAAFLPRGKKN